jgi:hydrogenase assembly chaperone HypC/HupF
MCVGIPGKVTRIKGKRAKIALPDHHHWVDTTMIEQRIKPGDYLLTYQNVAINRLTPAQAKETLKLLYD